MSTIFIVKSKSHVFVTAVSCHLLFKNTAGASESGTILDLEFLGEMLA